MSYGPLNPLSLENPHTPHFSSHLLPVEIPPKPIKHYVPLYFPQPIEVNATSPSFQPKALTPAMTLMLLADGALKCCLYPLVFVLTSQLLDKCPEYSLSLETEVSGPLSC